MRLLVTCFRTAQGRTLFMEGTRPSTVNSIGMFDMLKGMGMIVIVLAHTAELYPMQISGGLSLTAFFPFIYREALMAAFFIASGYGFRKRSIGKCIQQQLRALLKPYCITAVCTSLLHLLCHYMAFHYFPSSVTETLKVAGGFLLGLPHTTTYAGQQFFSTGPMWYLLSLMIAWILLDLILNIFPEQYINWAVLGTMLLGWGICITWEAPFCIGQGMVTVPALYVGYLAKKYKIFDQPLSPRLRGGMIAAALAVAALVLLTKSTDCVSMAEWTLGPVSILLDAVTGLGILSIVIWFQRRVENVVTHAIQAIGRRSLFIFCVHTVELTAIPWYLMPQKFAAHPVLGMVLQFTLSLGSTLLICELLVRRRDLKFWLTSRREQKAAEAPRRRSARTETPERHFAAKH